MGIVRSPLERVVSNGALIDDEIIWLPEQPFMQFLADPFGIWRDDKLYIFVEAYDHRDKIGRIDVITCKSDLTIVSRHTALKEQWHLSYPFIIDNDDGIFMLPEAARSGRLTLYRAVEFPIAWAPAAVLELDQVPLDATPFLHEGLWWLFYTPATRRLERLSALHVAFAKQITGPWTPHRSNPVQFDLAGSRPGGTPIVIDGQIVLPVQDCSQTYGEAVRPLHISKLTGDCFEAELGRSIRPPHAVAPYSSGLHTLSAAGDVTLIDAKRICTPMPSLAVEARYRTSRLHSAIARFGSFGMTPRGSKS